MTSAQRAVVIVGLGAAGQACARGLRAGGFEGRVGLVDGAEGGAINRTLVTKGVLPGLLTAEQIVLPPLADVDVIQGRVVELDVESRTVLLDDGRDLRGDAIVLACGSAPIALDAAIHVDADARVHTLHGARDAEALRQALPEPAGATIIVLGAGFIGTEVASHYAAAGASVTLVGRSALPMRAAVGADVAARLVALHAARVDLRLESTVRAVRAAGIRDRPHAVVVELADGSILDGDAVVVAVGSRPDAGWAGFEGVIAVDDRMRVGGRPWLYAAGSVAAPVVRGSARRVDHWDAAAAQGAHAAAALLHDLGLGADPGPWRPRTGFTLMAHGAVIGARGAWGPDAVASAVEVDGGMLTELATPEGDPVGVVGWNAGAQVARAAAGL